MAWGEIFSNIINIVTDFLIAIVKWPVLIWFKYMPKEIKYTIEGLFLILCAYMIFWLIKHRYDWMYYN